MSPKFNFCACFFQFSILRSYQFDLIQSSWMRKVISLVHGYTTRFVWQLMKQLFVYGCCSVHLDLGYDQNISTKEKRIDILAGCAIVLVILHSFFAALRCVDWLPSVLILLSGITDSRRDSKLSVNLVLGLFVIWELELFHNTCDTSWYLR